MRSTSRACVRQEMHWEHLKKRRGVSGLSSQKDRFLVEGLEVVNSPPGSDSLAPVSQVFEEIAHLLRAKPR